eukprot:Skav208727  [mRNA]  locus=scaffold615:133011:137950:+ [translate_table: standard]
MQLAVQGAIVAPWASTKTKRVSAAASVVRTVLRLICSALTPSAIVAAKPGPSAWEARSLNAFVAVKGWTVHFRPAFRVCSQAGGKLGRAGQPTLFLPVPGIMFSFRECAANVTKVQPGYFATESEPLKLFRCRPVERCPGGAPGSCAGAAEGTPCALCPEGKSWSGDDCVDCGATAVAWVIVALLVLTGSTAAYFFVNSAVTAQATPFKAAQMAAGLAVSTLQIVALLGLTSLKWPGNFQSVSSGMQVFVLDLESLHAGCALGSGPLASYALGITAFPLLVAWMMLCYGVTQIRWVQRCGIQRWKMPYTVNTVGLGLQLGFGTIAAVALKPMMCYEHPNGRYSVLSYPSIFCWEEGHGGMLACGILLLAVVVAGFPAACSYATWKLPYWSVTGNHAMVQCFRFCSANFQLNSYGFVLALLFRGLGFAVAIAAGTNLPPMQTALVSFVLVVYTVLQASIQPWKVRAVNLADSVVNASLLLLTGTTLPSDTQMETAFAEYFALLILVFVATTLCLLGLLCFVALLVDLRSGDVDAVLGLDGRRRDRQQIAEALQRCAGPSTPEDP